MEYADNPQLQLAYNFLQFTNRNVFLTGKAGTGKTTFLTRLKQSCPKRMVVLAPTGVAAINAGGVTLHSFFQLPFGPFMPGFVHSESGRPKYNFSKTKIDIIRTLDLLVIDEISMVRADLLDAVDDVLRRYRNNPSPFGGVQLLLIGDLHQLAPVVKDVEWDLLKNYYSTMYFFGSQALCKTDYVTIELTQVYRQASRHFVDILNKVRSNQADTSVFAELNQRYQPGFMPDDNDGYITLTTHNYQANEINQGKLKMLKTKLVRYSARVDGNFPEQMYPTEFELELKEGAQVMFVKNDVSPEKQYFNGKIGRIVNIEDDVVYVYCADDNQTISVTQAEWQNSNYKIDAQTKEIVETVEGTFKQYPLKLAWAITIHKSQGLTFDKVIIDAAQAFSHGQVYVALSRCRTFEGIVLTSRLGDGCLINDEQVSRFNDAVEQSVVDDAVLAESKLVYERDLINDLFDCRDILSEVQHCRHIFKKNSGALLGNPEKTMETVEQKLSTEIMSVAINFGTQVAQIISNGLCETNQFLQERIGKGCIYFVTKLDELAESLSEVAVSTDNSEVEKSAEESLAKIRQLVLQKRYCLESMKNGFSVQQYLKARAMALLQKNKPKKEHDKSINSKLKNNVTESVENPELFNLLKAWRAQKAKDESMPLFYVLHQKTLVEIVGKMPDSVDALSLIRGMGKVKTQKFGSEIVEIVRQYKRENGFKMNDTSSELFEERLNPKQDTKEQTFQLYMDGFSVEQIAETRHLSISTVVTHLCHYVQSGMIEPTDILDPDKVEQIADYFCGTANRSLAVARQALGDEYSYDEIKLVLCWVEANA